MMINPINPNFVNTILTLSNRLSERNIPHTCKLLLDGMQICFPWNKGDLVCHCGSYGHEDGAVESFNCPWDNGDVTCLDIEEALNLITEWYTKDWT